MLLLLLHHGEFELRLFMLRPLLLLLLLCSKLRLHHAKRWIALLSERLLGRDFAESHRNARRNVLQPSDCGASKIE